jgi:hypothetical protein
VRLDFSPKKKKYQKKLSSLMTTIGEPMHAQQVRFNKFKGTRRGYHPECLDYFDIIADTRLTVWFYAPY